MSRKKKRADKLTSNLADENLFTEQSSPGRDMKKSEQKKRKKNNIFLFEIKTHFFCLSSSYFHNKASTESCYDNLNEVIRLILWAFHSSLKKPLRSATNSIAYEAQWGTRKKRKNRKSSSGNGKMSDFIEEGNEKRSLKLKRSKY